MHDGNAGAKKALCRKASACSCWTVVPTESGTVLLCYGPVNPQPSPCMLFLCSESWGPAPQLLGFSDVVTGAMSACTTAGVALGFIVGGTLGDLLSHIMPDYARPAVNQVPWPCGHQQMHPSVRRLSYL